MIYIKLSAAIIFIVLGFIVDYYYLKKKSKKGEKLKKKLSLKNYSAQTLEFLDSDIIYFIGEVALITIISDSIFSKEEEISTLTFILILLGVLATLLLINYLRFKMRILLLDKFLKASSKNK